MISAFLVTDWGRPFSAGGLGNKMRQWCDQAALFHCTMHGLRKTLGKYLAEEGATAKQAASILGHDDLDHVELYSKEAEQERLAADASAGYPANMDNPGQPF